MRRTQTGLSRLRRSRRPDGRRPALNLYDGRGGKCPFSMTPVLHVAGRKLVVQPAAVIATHANAISAPYDANAAAGKNLALATSICQAIAPRPGASTMGDIASYSEKAILSQPTQE
jgi:hypothetical protein